MIARAILDRHVDLDNARSRIERDIERDRNGNGLLEARLPIGRRSSRQLELELDAVCDAQRT